MTLRNIFPYAKFDDVKRLRFQINRQNSTQNAKRVMNAWIDETWPVPQSTTESPSTSSESPFIGSFANPSHPKDSGEDDFHVDDSSEGSGNIDEKPHFGDQINEVTDLSEVTTTLTVDSGDDFYYDDTNDTVTDDNSWWTTTSTTLKPLKFKRSVDGDTVTRNWEDAWFKNDVMMTTPHPWKNRCLYDKEFARSQGLAFLDHRDTLKIYIRYIFRIGQEQKLLTKEEAEKMRDIFWKNDRLYDHNFPRVELGFLKEVTEDHVWKQSDYVIYRNLKMYAAHWYKFPPIAEKLNWVLEEDSWSCRYQHYKMEHNY
ncbi:hypothetical protein GCK72_020996 [Caenorhabditis remanei]|uniref:Uncharacterized protein n=1 Tax=Caenorhabditis remanei TaxID=31234 RepID=A0A6A5GIP2_CAERE|nr:hypothetical protein GCK72_020996 [Caenorhabditis remanei]KAF1754435.1 hypothetical protein GCK72_020996 [Caenorhabditis remanei]